MMETKEEKERISLRNYKTNIYIYIYIYIYSLECFIFHKKM